MLLTLASLAARVLLAAIFLQGGVQKLRHFRVWQGVAANYRVLPDWAVPGFALLLPMGEILLAAGFGIDGGVAAAVGAMALLVPFSLAIAINLARGRSEIDCGCFQSTLRQTLSVRLLVRNAALFSIAALLAMADTPIASATALAVGAMFGAVCFALYLTVNELLI